MPTDPVAAAKKIADQLGPPEAPTVDDVAADPQSTLTLPGCGAEASVDWPSIPGYEISREIARGGMGRVFAGRDLTLDREVAVKTLLPGADAERFVTESKITARLPHPGIPPVHALGMLADGAPYLVMKLIRGRTLADLLKERPTLQHDLSRWVQVFEQIAQAVGFAHAQGIIHRDLKPSNIMAGAFGEVQVMDWGLAKDVTSRENGRPESGAAESPNRTQAGAILGTPSYMAPEQARGENVDARADVFALGGILTAILTGDPPFVGGSVQEIVAKAALAELTETLRLIDGCGADAELIALAKRCLATNTVDRPADARAVAQEVAAYRAGVEARLRQAETERAAAFARVAEQRKRRRQFVWAAGIVTVVLISGIIGTTIGMVSAANEAAAKEAARQNEATARASEKDRADGEAKAKANAESAFAETTKRLDLLVSVIADIDYRKVRADGNDMTDELANRLIETAKRLDIEPPSERAKLAELQDRIGRTLISLGRSQEAIPILQKACKTMAADFGSDDAHTLSSMNNLAVALQETAQLAEALPLIEEVLQKRKAKCGLEHPDTLVSMNNFAKACLQMGETSKAVQTFSEVLEIKVRLSPQDQSVLGSKANLASALLEDGQIQKALHLHQEAEKGMAAKLGADHPDTLTARSALASTLMSAGQIDEAIRLNEVTFERRKIVLGSEHPDTLVTMNNLAMMYKEIGQYEKTLTLLKKALEIGKIRRGEDHPETLTTMANLAVVHWELKQFAEALSGFHNVLTRSKAILGPDHPNTLATIANLAEAYRESGQWTKALPLAEEAFSKSKAKLGPLHPDSLLRMHKLARVYADARQTGKAWPLFQESAKGLKSRLAPDHPNTLTTMNDLAESYRKNGQLERALPLFEETFERLKATLGPNHPRTLACMNNLAIALQDDRQFAKAVRLHEESLERNKSTLPPDAPSILVCMSNLASAYLAVGQTEKALLLAEETLKKRTAIFGSIHSNTLVSMNNLAHVYSKTGQLGKAITVYESALETMRANPAIGQPLAETIHNLSIAYRDDRQMMKAAKLFEDLVERMKLDPGPDHIETLIIMHELAFAWDKAGHRKKALPLFEKTLERMSATLPANHESILRCMNSLATIHAESKQFDKAIKLFEDALAGSRTKLAPAHDLTLLIMNNLAVSYGHSGRIQEAFTLFDELLEKRAANLGRLHEQTQRSLEELHAASVAICNSEFSKGNYPAAESYLRKGLTTLDKSFPNSWESLSVRGMLADALARQKKHEEAEKLLLDVVGKIKASRQVIPLGGRIPIATAANSLAKIHDTGGRKDDAEKWKKITNEILRPNQSTGGKQIGKIYDVDRKLALTNKLDAQTHAVIYQVRLKAGISYTIDMVSLDHKALDPYLYLRDEKDEVLAEDDDSGGGLNARIVHTPKADGVYRIRATSFDNGRGDFTLTVRESAVPPPKVDAPKVAAALLDKKDSLTDKDPGWTPTDPNSNPLLKLVTGNPYKVYTLNLMKGDKLSIRIRSSDKRIDPVVAIEDGKGKLIAFNDDEDYKANILDSKLVVMIPVDGKYRIIATCSHEVIRNKYGDFQITVEKAK